MSRGGWIIGSILPINVPKMSHRENSFVFIKKTFKVVPIFYQEPGLYPSIADNVDTMNILFQERHNHSENCITVKVSWWKQWVAIYLGKERYVLAIFSLDLGHNFGGNVGNEFGAMLRGKRTSKARNRLQNCPHTFSHDIQDLIEYNSAGDRKTLLLHSFLFISKLKAGDIITTRQYMN